MAKHRNQPNLARWQAEHGRRSSSAAQPHRNKARYYRPRKHKGQGYE